MFIPQWPIQHRVSALSTTRNGGVSQPPFASFNLAYHVGDKVEHVDQNLHILKSYIPRSACWVDQVHGSAVFHVKKNTDFSQRVQADALYTEQRLQPLAIMTADCLPILLSSFDGKKIAAIHGGWRSLKDGIIKNTLSLFNTHPRCIFAWLGPAIGAQAFEVGKEVRDQFSGLSSDHDRHFIKLSKNKYLANIYSIATWQLKSHGLVHIYTQEQCTVDTPNAFYSFRREGQTGRMASIIWRH